MWDSPGQQLLQACWREPRARGSKDGARGSLASRPQLGRRAVASVQWVPLGLADGTPGRQQHVERQWEPRPAVQGLEPPSWAERPGPRVRPSGTRLLCARRASSRRATRLSWSQRCPQAPGRRAAQRQVWGSAAVSLLFSPRSKESLIRTFKPRPRSCEAQGQARPGASTPRGRRPGHALGLPRVCRSAFTCPS